MVRLELLDPLPELVNSVLALQSSLHKGDMVGALIVVKIEFVYLAKGSLQGPKLFDKLAVSSRCLPTGFKSIDDISDEVDASKKIAIEAKPHRHSEGWLQRILEN
jgi:hypothetical protein